MDSPAVSAVLNHLWQTTLFVGAMAAVAHLLKLNSARARFLVWFAASVKFLIPLSAFIALGSALPNDWHTAGSPAQPLTTVAAQVVGPLSPFGEGRVLSPIAAGMDSGTDYFGWLGALAWALGSLYFSAAWLVVWLRLRRNLLGAATAPEVAFPVPVRIAPPGIGPGVVGVFRPMLILPSGLSARLQPAQLAAILEHERCHCERRDNLTAVIHRVVQTVFWFHPAVWWIGTKLADERERACDEQVVARGHRPATYAEGILAVCEQHLQTRVPGLAGVSGGSLEGRVRSILEGQPVKKLNAGRRLTVALTLGAAALVPLVIGALAPSTTVAQGVEVTTPLSDLRNVSIAYSTGPADQRVEMSFGDDGKLTIKNLPVRTLIAVAYGVAIPQVFGPGSTPEVPWSSGNGELRFDITAERISGSRTVESWRAALRELLASRFSLIATSNRRAVEGYVLQVGATGSRMDPQTNDPARHVWVTPSSITVTSLPVSSLTEWLSNAVRMPIADETKLYGNYTYAMHWDRTSTATMPTAAEIIPALEGQLGLRLERGKPVVDVVDVQRLYPPAPSTGN